MLALLTRPVHAPLVREITDWSGSSLAAQVAALFASGMKGAWYERSNRASLFQDSVGTTPVTAVGQPVGLMLDVRYGLVRNAEAIVNNSFDSGAANWVVTGSDVTHIVTIAGGTLRYQSDLTTPVLAFANSGGIALVIGKTYEIVIDVASATTTTGLKSDHFFGTSFATVAGVITYRLAATASGQFAMYRNGNLVDLVLNSISIKEIPGNHQLQATASARALYQIAPQRLVFDGVDDVLNTTFATALGTNCTVGWAIPGTGAVIATAQTIDTSYADSISACALVVFDGPLTADQTVALTGYLNQQAAL